MIECGICGKTFKSRRGLAGHVTGSHKVQWTDYQTEHPLIEVPDHDVEEEAGAPAETDDIHEMVGIINERVGRLEGMFNTLVGGVSPTGLPSGITDFPGEDVEVIGEKLNYKIALNPAIFSRYDKFKAVSKRRGREWTGDFSDFIDLATKDVLAVYGIYDTVVEMRGNRILLEIPTEMNPSG